MNEKEIKEKMEQSMKRIEEERKLINHYQSKVTSSIIGIIIFIFFMFRTDNFTVFGILIFLLAANLTNALINLNKLKK